MNLHHPAVQSVFLPFAVALAATGLLRLAGGRGRGPRLTSLAVALGLFAATISLLGAPAWPPVGSLDKFVYLVAAGLLFGLLLDLGTPPWRIAAALGVLWLGAVLAWLAWPQLDRREIWWLLGALELGGLVVVLRVTDLTRPDLSAVVMLLVAALGLGGVALNSGSLVIAQLASALAAALGGFVLWNWPTPRFRFGAAGVFGAAVPLLALAALTLLLTDANPWALAPLVLVFFADLVSRRLPPTRGRWRDVLGPVYLALIAALPAGLAVALTLIGHGADDAYYR